jgi:hypothetical protein
MGRADLIGSAKHQLVPAFLPAGTGRTGGEGRRMPRTARAQKFLTKGVPVRQGLTLARLPLPRPQARSASPAAIAASAADVYALQHRFGTEIEE